MTTQEIIADIIEKEGPAFTNRAADKGGPTKWGVTQAALSSYRGRACAIDEVKALTRAEAEAVYLHDYVEKPGFLLILDDRLRVNLVDAGVQHGVGRATRWLQKILSVKEDGQLGPVTAKAVNDLPERGVSVIRHEFMAVRCLFYFRIIADDYNKKRAQGLCPPMQAENAGGWGSRIGAMIREG